LHKLNAHPDAVTPILLKILNERSAPSDLVESLSRAVLKLESNNPQLKHDLKKYENRVAASRLIQRRKMSDRYGMVDSL
jgi:hypothetical protein